ncbi:MAG: SDR family NAD(P)-dependent oxidoreductase [Gammaproteobacteria bacterium]|nr:SDR family NAD(P)-dependent oxidoreductase [Gammaproteobacteria bacterium]
MQRTLANWGANVAVTCLADSDALQESLRRDLRRVGIDDQRLSARRMDLCSPESVAEFAAWYEDRHGRELHVLVNNAGIHRDLLGRHSEPIRSADGFEIHWRTNYLGTFQLTSLLLPMLVEGGRRSGDARIVNVVSHLHDRGSNAGFFDEPRDYNSWQAYGQSKLALVHFSRELQRRFGEKGNLKSVALHPGSSSTNMTFRGLREYPVLWRVVCMFAPLESLVLLSPAQGAQTSIMCASTALLEGGGYYERCAIAGASEDAGDAMVAKRLWETTQDWVASLV